MARDSSTQRTYWAGKPEKLRRIISADLPLSTRLALLRAAVARRSGSGETELRTGPLTLRLADEDNVDWRIVLGIFVDGDYATSYDGAVVLDVGAHKGFFGAYAVSRGARAVISYEPSSSNYAALERHAGQCRSKGIDWSTRHAAVGAERGEAVLHLAEQSWQNTLLADAPQVGGRSEQVPVAAMTDALDEARAAGGRLIVKIDTEGYECEIVSRTPPEAWGRVAELFVEVEPNAPCSHDEIVEELEAGGLNLRGLTAPDVLHFVRGAAQI